jgi:LPS sulfotransferase NodH
MAHPLSGADWATLSRVVTEAGDGIDQRRLLAIRAAVLGRLPFTAFEKARSEAILPRLADLPPPVFILGHWRSGTTHLYNIMALGRFGYVPPVAVGMPWDMLYLGRALEPLLERALPDSRYIDKVPVTPTSPQEDEIAVANMSPLSFYHGIYFPRRFDWFVDRGLFHDHADPSEVAQWEAAFTLFLRKCSHAQGLPMLVKNPVYTARPAQIRRIFPRAKFIHIHRDPFDVFLSMRNFWKQLLSVMALQRFDHVDIDGTILRIYDRMMHAFAVETTGWEAPDMVEVAYADLDRQPLDTVRHIYETLDLPGFADAAPRFAAYLDSIRSYEKNRFRGDAAMVARVSERWAPWIERWGYRAPLPAA